MNTFIDAASVSSALHQHDNYEVIVCTGGSGVYCDGTEYPVEQGDIILVPPNVMHEFIVSDTLDRIFIIGECKRYFSLTSSLIIRDTPLRECATLANLLYNNRYADQGYIGILTDAFIHCVMRNMRTQGRLHTAITGIMDQIAVRFHDPSLNLQSLLNASGYAEDYIRAQFKETTGQTPNEFLTHTRIRHAHHLIDTYGDSIPLAEIAEKCGYTDYVYFSKKFKSVSDVSPRAYIRHIVGHH